MARLGSYCGIVFEVSSKKVLTPTKISHSASSTWATHNRIGLKPRTEKTGNGLQKVSYTLVLRASHGVRPRQTLAQIKSICDTGKIGYFIIGSQIVGGCRYRLTQYTDAWDTIYSRGELSKATVQITLEEYQ